MAHKVIPWTSELVVAHGQNKTYINLCVADIFCEINETAFLKK